MQTDEEVGKVAAAVPVIICILFVGIYPVEGYLSFRLVSRLRASLVWEIGISWVEPWTPNKEYYTSDTELVIIDPFADLAVCNLRFRV